MLSGRAIFQLDSDVADDGNALAPSLYWFVFSLAELLLQRKYLDEFL